MDGMNGTELHEWTHEDHGNVDPAHNGIDTLRDPTERALIENGRIRDKVRAELAAHAREFQRVFMANRLLVPRQSLQTLAEWNADEQYGHEWCLNAARTDEELIAVYQTQLADYAVTKEQLAAVNIERDDLRRECASLKRALAVLRDERDTLAAKLDAANAKLAALENAALVAESATTSADLVVNGDQSAPASADAPDDDVTVALMDERVRPPMKLTPPARKPDAAA